MTAMLSVRVYAEVNGPINVGITCRPEHDRHAVFFGQDNQPLNLTVRPSFVITLSFKTIGGNNGFA